MVKKALDVPAVRVKVTLVGITPPVWRRLVLPGHWHLGKVHDALQVAFGWEDDHLHEFDADGVGYGDPDRLERAKRESTVRVHELLVAPNDTITYTYDFGDDWRHKIVVEEVLEPTTVARCLAGRRAAPPEDSGGRWGYAEKLNVLADPDHEDYAEVTEWMDAGWDPELVDIAAIDAYLSRLR